MSEDEPINQSPESPSESNSLDAASTLSQVSRKPRHKFKGSLIHWIVGVVILVILLSMVFSGGHKKPPNNENTHLTNTQDFNLTLQQNLATLEQMKARAETQVEPVSPVENAALSKEYLARQNAPSNIYSASPPTRVNTSQASNSAPGAMEATFAGNGVYDQFGNQSTTTVSVSAQHIAHPRDTIASGEFIHAVLETAIDSDLPGLVRAVISEPVYAYVGNEALIPAGSRLIGQYSSATVQGINRVMVVWNRVILPNGIAVQINSPGTDELGRSGQGADSVNTHFFARFGEAALLSLIGAGASTDGVNTNDQYNSASQYRMAVAQAFQQSAQNTLQNSVPMKPTLHMYQGAQINVFVARDLSFYPVLNGQHG